MKAQKLLALFLLVGFLLAACSPVTPTAPANNSGDLAAGPTPSPWDGANGNTPEAALLAVQALATQTGYAADDIQIREIKQMEWPDTCLGLGGPAESCGMMIVNGYQIILAVGDETFEFRTNDDGSQIRMVEPQGSVDLPKDEFPGAVLAARQILAQQLQLNLDEIEVVRFDAVDWPNSCLGIERADMACMMVITPGYQILLQAEGKSYEYHTDIDGGVALLATAPAVEVVNDAALVWEQTENGVCSRLEIHLNNGLENQVVYGPCGGPLVEGKLVQPEREAQLEELLSTYGPFFVGTPAGTVQFNGQGTQEATEAEQRSIAEWARLVRMEAESGRSGASWGLAFAWNREGGIAGFCDNLEVYATGWAYASSCKGDQPENLGSFRLTAEQLEQVYEWMDEFKGFESIQDDGAVADSMQVRLVFSGSGAETASAEEQQDVANFAAEIYGNARQ